MATKGRFGHRPRVAQDYSSAIADMIRAFNNQRESNIVSAWTKGGEFEGKKVTDQMLLKFYDDRVDLMDPTDPEYDHAKELRDQYAFAIRSSKMDQRYAQKDVSDFGMSSFYRGEAASHPKNSEIYRQLMTLSAQYAERGRAATSAGAGGQAARNKILQAQVDKPGAGETAWDAAMNTIVELARQGGVLVAGQDLGDLQAGQFDLEKLSSIIDEFATSDAYKPWRDQLTSWIRKNGDPHFDGNFSLAGFQAMRGNKVDALHVRLDLAGKQGTKSQSKALVKAIGAVSSTGSQLSLITPLTHYEEAYTLFEKIQNDPNTDVGEKWASKEAYRAVVIQVATEIAGIGAGNFDAGTGVSADAGAASAIAGKLNAEADCLGGQCSVMTSTVHEDTRGGGPGLGAGPGPDSSEMRVLQDNATAMVADIQKLITRDASGMPAYLLAKKTDGTWAPLAVQDLRNAGVDFAILPSGADKSITVYGQTVDLGGVMTAVIGEPVFAEQPNDLLSGGVQHGNVPLPGTNRQIATLYTDPVTKKIVYKYNDSAGVPHYSATFPGADGVTLTKDSNGWVAHAAASPGVPDPGKPASEKNKGGFYDPRTLLGVTFTDPVAIAATPGTIFDSSYVAFHMGTADDPRAALSEDPTAIAAAMLVEAKGDPARYQTLMASVDRSRAAVLASTPLADYDPSWLDNMTPAQKALMPMSTSLGADMAGAKSPVGYIQQVPTADDITVYRQRAKTILDNAHILADTSKMDPRQLADYVRKQTGQIMGTLGMPGPQKTTILPMLPANGILSAGSDLQDRLAAGPQPSVVTPGSGAAHLAAATDVAAKQAIAQIAPPPGAPVVNAATGFVMPPPPPPPAPPGSPIVNAATGFVMPPPPPPPPRHGV